MGQWSLCHVVLHKPSDYDNWTKQSCSSASSYFDLHLNLSQDEVTQGGSLLYRRTLILKFILQINIISSLHGTDIPAFGIPTACYVLVFLNRLPLNYECFITGLQCVHPKAFRWVNDKLDAGLWCRWLTMLLTLYIPVSDKSSHTKT